MPPVMASPKPNKNLFPARRHRPEPEHPSALRRRLSLGLDNFISVVPLRKTTPQQESYLRATTAPSPTRPLLPQGINPSRVTARQIPDPQIHLSPLIEPQEPCPYDQTKYHSFSSIERSRCTFCGMRSSRPRSSFRPKQMSASSRMKPSSPEYLPRSSGSSDECPRIVPPEIAAKRIGNPPRRAALPVPRQGAISNVLNPLPNHPVSHSIKRSSVSRSESALESEQVRATSPKLHHLHGLPDSKAYPYVHKKEVQQHFAAIRAGASSPLTDFALAAQQKKEQKQSIDFSETIYYGRTPKPALVSDVHKSFPEQARRGDVFVEHTLVVGGHVLTERSRSERLRSVNDQSYSRSVPARSSARLTHQPRVERASKEGEIHGNALLRQKSHETSNSTVKTSSGDVTPLGLRGGGRGDAYSPGCGFLLKQLFLTCRRPRRDMMDMSSDDDNVPPRIADPVQIARTKCRAQGTARLPKHIIRGCEPQATSRTTIAPASNGQAGIKSSSGAEVTPLPRRVTFAHTYKPPRPLVCRLPSFNRSFALRLTVPSHAQKLSRDIGHLTRQSATSITPCLRGGAGLPSTLRNDQDLPPTFFWLAGGDRRKAVRTESWKAQRPKARRGGMLGWAVHGLQAGKEYGKAEGKSSSRESAEVSGSRVAKQGKSLAEERKQNEGSSPKGNSSGVAKREVEEAKEDAALNPVPEVDKGDGGSVPEQTDGK